MLTAVDAEPALTPRPSASDNVEEGSTVPPLPELSTSTSTSVGGKRRGSAGTLAGGAPSPPKVNRGSSTLNSARGEGRRQHDAKMLTRDNTRMGILRQAQAAAAEKTPPRDGFTTPPHGGAHDHHHGHHGDHHESIMHKLSVSLHHLSEKFDTASDRVRDSIWRDSVDHHDSDNEQEDELRHRASHRAHSTAHSPAESRPLSRSSSFQRHGSSSFADALHSDGTGRLHAHSGHRERAVSHHKLSIVDATITVSAKRVRSKRRIGSGWMEQITVTADALELRVTSSKANKFADEQHQVLGLHLDVEFLTFDEGAVRGALPEMWGLQPMTEKTKLLQDKKNIDN